ncbi:MAG: lipid-A-disaccharide synthase [Pseudomonadota bacterium]
MSFGVRTVHYVSPSVWAWRSGRVRTVKKAVDRVLCILPFEKAIYDQHDVDAVFVGHPRADAAPETVDTDAARRTLGIQANEVVAILPGSRMSEVTRLGEILVEAAAVMARDRSDMRFVTPAATPKLRTLIDAQIAAADMTDKFQVLDGQSDLAMRAADVVLLASGTAALESALLGKPTVATYRLAWLSHLLLIRSGVVKVTHYTLPNLLTEEPLVPELMQNDAEPTSIAAAVAALLDDPERRESIRHRFAKLRAELAQDTDQRAADAVIELANR